ncbi:MAG: hypothetical protein EBE86_014150 [Hormoscilla sp. GUM202]|nr:hypothetical protein [Hormoscilla sp. GUM202]
MLVGRTPSDSKAIACIVKKCYHERITNRGGDRRLVARNRVSAISSGQDPRWK